MESHLLLSAVRVDLMRQQVERDGTSRGLTSMESALLRYLAARAGETVSREELLQDVWAYQPGTLTRAVDFTVHRLRRKIEANPSDPDHLQTVHGSGYRLILPAGSRTSGDSNLPPDESPFFGRQGTLHQVEQALSEKSRLITLHGPGGAGKTRLALRVAADVRERYPGGVWLVELASARSVGALIYAVAAALTLPLSSTTVEAQRAELARHIRRRGPTLLVLDNVESVVDEGAPLVGRLLSEAPSLTVLVTSRQRLGIAGERPVSVAALDLAAGVSLFAARAAAVCPGFQLRPSERRVIAEIVECLDGLPLAIELAAGRAALLSPSQIRDRLPSRFSMLTGPAGGLQSVIEGSWSLLSAWEQAALGQLSVFRGGFTVAAAEHVLSLPHDALLVIDALQGLIDKSLLLRRPRRPSEPQRFSLGESIRLFAEARLQEQDASSEAYARHRAFYLRRWRAPERAASVTSRARREALAADLDNLIAIWRRALPGEPSAAVKAIQAMLPLFLSRGPSRALLKLLDQAVEASPGARLRAEALHARGSVRLLLGQLQDALADLDAALSLNPATADHLQMEVMTDRGLCLDRLGRVVEAESVYAAALAGFQALGSVAGIARVEGYMGTCRFHQGDVEGARVLLERSIAGAQATGQHVLAASMEANLGSVRFKQEQLSEAEHHYRRALAFFKSEGDIHREGMGRILLGMACILQDRLDEAERYLEEGVALQERIGAQREAGIGLGWLATMYHLRGDHPEADEGYAAAVELLSASGDTHHQTFIYSTWSMLCSSGGRSARASDCLAQAELLGDVSSLPSHARTISLARLFLDAGRLSPSASRAPLLERLSQIPVVSELRPFWSVLRRQLSR